MKQYPSARDRAALREFYMRQHRPAWWPDNEEWPPRDPRHWRRMTRHNPFFRRMGCLFAAFNFVWFGLFVTLLGFILNALGIIQVSAQQYQWIFPIAVILFAFIVLIFILTARNFRRISNPLDELVHASNKVADGDYSVRVAENGTPEVRSLLRGFNSMTERLQSHDQQRRNMLADVSHELRTPITIIQGNVEGILDGMYPADEARLKSILEETQILSRLVEDLRTMALAESGSLRLQREPTDLRLLIQEVVSRFDAQTKEKGIQMDVSLADVEDLHVDALRLREVLNNLFSNALRYTPRGGTVNVTLTESGSGDERAVLVTIQDSGEGIDPADLPHVFERFYKSSDSGGMGLGLSIAKYIVEAHGGNIWAESELERGTKISLTLPA